MSIRLKAERWHSSSMGNFASTGASKAEDKNSASLIRWCTSQIYVFMSRNDWLNSWRSKCLKNNIQKSHMLNLQITNRIHGFNFFAIAGTCDSKTYTIQNPGSACPRSSFLIWGQNRATFAKLKFQNPESKMQNPKSRFGGLQMKNGYVSVQNPKPKSGRKVWIWTLDWKIFDYGL